MKEDIKLLAGRIQQANALVTATRTLLSFDTDAFEDPESAKADIQLVCCAALMEVICFQQSAQIIVDRLAKIGGKA